MQKTNLMMLNKIKRILQHFKRTRTSMDFK